jgi:hypothetical protein
MKPMIQIAGVKNLTEAKMLVSHPPSMIKVAQ